MHTHTYTQVMEVGVRATELWRPFPLWVEGKGATLRGLAEEGKYPYAQDGLRLFNAFHKYALAYLHASGRYGDDKAVADDKELQAHTQTQAYTHSGAHTRAISLTHMGTHTGTHTHAHTRARTHTHSRTHIHSHT